MIRQLLIVAGLFGLMILYCAWMHVASEKRQQLPGHCQHCGYDLTGNESGICPECGRVAVA